MKMFADKIANFSEVKIFVDKTPNFNWNTLF